MRILFLGDIVGRTARQTVIEQMPDLRAELDCSFVIVNCENAAGGYGVTPAICEDLFASGIDVLTTGNHVFDKAEINPYLTSQGKLLRPDNMAEGLPGKGYVIMRNDEGARLGVVNLMANLYMAENANAFSAADKIKASMTLGRDVDVLVVDFHGEATSEKMAMGHYLDGHVSLVVGTHTHIPTADCRVLDGGTAYQTDAGMCGNYNSVIGMDKQAAIGRFTGESSRRLSVADGAPSLCGVLVDVDPATGLAKKAFPFRRGGALENTSSV